MNFPKKGQVFKFYDDCKTGPYKKHYGQIKDIITIEDAKNINVLCNGDYKYGVDLKNLSIYDAWKKNAGNIPFAEKTDYVLIVDVPSFDDEVLYAVRGTDNNWYTMNIHSNWQFGIVDVDDTWAPGVYWNDVYMPEF